MTVRLSEAWAKSVSERTQCYHRLEHHCGDVAACFEQLLTDPVLLDRFQQACGGQSFCKITKARLAVLAFLHDLGKINVPFQLKLRDRTDLPRSGHIREALWCIYRHGTASYCEALGLYEMLDSWKGGFESLLCASLAHHGIPAVDKGNPHPSLWEQFEDYSPLDAARLLGERCRRWFPDAFVDGPSLPQSSQLQHLFAGTLTIADHIGSDVAYFPYEPEEDIEYIRRARRQAVRAVKAKGYGRAGRRARLKAEDFESIFGFSTPRPLQRAVMSTSVDQPLLILESETGSGKTEAAVLRFVALWEAGKVDGLYFALPTRSAALQLQRRVNKALRKFFGDQVWANTLVAVPGYVIAGEAKGKRVGRFDLLWEDEPDEEARTARWAAEGARLFLCATAAVGTVDQALLAGLKVKWAHLRGAALARSLLVVDEVHASDAYMTEVLCGVLSDHLEVGGYAMLMSATLGSVAQTAFVSRGRRHSVPPLADVREVPYPAVTLAGDNGVETHRIRDTGAAKEVSVQLEPLIDQSSRVAAMALDAARLGAKVLVIRNTVRMAMAVFDALSMHSELLLQVNEGPALHHSRFAAEDRKRLDHAVEEAFGVGVPLGQARAGGGVIVIGTQTLEQSLDIDSDFLITDLCPADVLLQRVGRLHRHDRPVRPEQFEEPACVVLTPSLGLEQGLSGGLAKYGLGTSKSGVGVYRNLVGLEATRRLAEQHGVWRIPAMNRELVEETTHTEALENLAKSLGGPWIAGDQQIAGFLAAERQVARGNALRRTECFSAQGLAYPVDDERIRTRLGEDACRVKLQKPARGPFGEDVRNFSLPAHYFGKAGLPSKQDTDGASVESTADGLLLRIGGHAFAYSRRGLRPVER